MRRIGTLFLLIGSTLALSAHAYTANCALMPGGSSCGQCYAFDLGQNNRPSDTFIPRSGLTSAQQEWIDLSQSSITGTAYQGIVAGPTGNITDKFNLVDHGNGGSAWVWAQMKSNTAITYGAVPAGINYNSPAYSVKFITKSNIRENGVLSPDRGVTHSECSYFFLKAPANATCGNAVRDYNEQCDDGNKNNLDACSNTCTLPLCGNGIIEGHESCDDGNTNNNDGCSNVCNASVCGNGLREGGEQCDDGNANNNDGCTNACLVPGNTATCGNGVREGGEQCDDGNTNNTDACTNQCRTAVVNALCNVRVLDTTGAAPLQTSILCSGQPQGRSVIAITKNNSVLATFEANTTPYTFSQVGHYTVYCYPDARDQSNSCRTTVDLGAVCGNSLVEKGEQCDDGNTFSGDSCDRNCRVEGSTCGNGILERGEECDDGNNYTGDKCSNICERELQETGPIDMLWLVLGLSLFTAGIVTYRKYLRN